MRAIFGGGLTAIYELRDQLAEMDPESVSPELKEAFCAAWPEARRALDTLRSISGLLHGGGRAQGVIAALTGAGDKACEVFCPPSDGHP